MTTKHKDCHCFTCDKDFHWLGIARHRAWHRDNKTNCRIMFSDGNIKSWSYGTKDKS